MILMLQLSSGNVAIFNNARELTGIMVTTDLDTVEERTVSKTIEWIRTKLWRTPNTPRFEKTVVDDTPKEIDLDQFL